MRAVYSALLLVVSVVSAVSIGAVIRSAARRVPERRHCAENILRHGELFGVAALYDDAVASVPGFQSTWAVTYPNSTPWMDRLGALAEWRGAGPGVMEACCILLL